MRTTLLPTACLPPFPSSSPARHCSPIATTPSATRHPDFGGACYALFHPFSLFSASSDDAVCPPAALHDSSPRDDLRGEQPIIEQASIEPPQVGRVPALLAMPPPSIGIPWVLSTAQLHVSGMYSTHRLRLVLGRWAPGPFVAKKKSGAERPSSELPQVGRYLLHLNQAHISGIYSVFCCSHCPFVFAYLLPAAAGL